VRAPDGIHRRHDTAELEVIDGPSPNGSAAPEEVINMQSIQPARKERRWSGLT
jgi:hypothetical protein